MKSTCCFRSSERYLSTQPRLPNSLGKRLLCALKTSSSTAMRYCSKEPDLRAFGSAGWVNLKPLEIDGLRPDGLNHRDGIMVQCSLLGKETAANLEWMISVPKRATTPL